MFLRFAGHYHGRPGKPVISLACADAVSRCMRLPVQPRRNLTVLADALDCDGHPMMRFLYVGLLEYR